MPILPETTSTTINDSNLTDVAGDATFNFNFANDGPLVNLFIQHMVGSPLPTDLYKNLGQHIISQNINNLPRASAAYDDYTTQDKRRVACFEGTREALLQEIAKWILCLSGPRLYLLWGIAGVGKSTVAQTVAERADNVHRLGASFFFSRDEIERKNARMFFTTIAFHLCIFSEDFARVIENVLLTQRGRAAISKEPLEQLKTLILDPLRNFNHQDVIPIAIVIDALDECDDQDGPTIFIGLARLVQELPFFRVILTTRPRPHLQVLIDNPNTQTEFHLQNIEDKIVNNDIQRYLEHSLSHEQVQKHLPMPRNQWSASGQDILSLVRAADRLFIIASTSVLFILDKAARNPTSRMKTLQDQFAQNRALLNPLNEFYTIILRSAVPEGCECDIVDQYQFVAGTIILIQDPLPVEALAILIGLPEQSVYAVLDNLQSVISISRKNIPRVYHKSFPDYLTDDTRCKDNNLRIDLHTHHTRIAVRCLQLLNRYLKKNILGIGTHQGFVDNGDRLREENITTEQLMEKIPGELRYACVYWANHVKGTDTANVNLAKEAETFVIEHLLHWLEALSWINEINAAYPAVNVLLKYMPTSSDVNGIISDALRFIARFSEDIRRSALYTYYCALPFTPTNCPLYKIYSKEILYQLEGVSTQWDALTASFKGEGLMFDSPFSYNSSKFASRSGLDGTIRLRDAESGVLLRTYGADLVAVTHDFSIAAMSEDRTVTLWSVEINAPVATVTTSEIIKELALSSDGSRLAARSRGGAVTLWDTRSGKLVASLKDYGDQLKFSPRHNRLAFVSADGTMWLWNGDDGGLIARLDYKSKKNYSFIFSHDGRRLAASTEDFCLTLWDAEKGISIGFAEDAGYGLDMSEDGYFIATGGHEVQLWSGDSLALVDTLDVEAHDVAISCDLLAAASRRGVTLYDAKNRTVISTLHSESEPLYLALSPDCTRLLVQYYEYSSEMFDVALFKPSIPVPKRQVKSKVSALAFSPDSSRLTSGLQDGTVELWDPNCAERPIATHRLHTAGITTLAFSLDGQRFASGSWGKTMRLWDGKDGILLNRFQYPSTNAFAFSLNNAIRTNGLAFSLDLLAATAGNTITLFDNKSLLHVGTLEGAGRSLIFSGDGTLLASASHNSVKLWNVAEHAWIATFTARSGIRTLTFSPDGSQLAATMDEYEGYQLFTIVSKRSIEPTRHGHPSWIPGVMKNGLLISCAGHYKPGSQHLIGRYSRNHDWIGVLWVSDDFDVRKVEFGSFIIALGCEDGRILFVRFPTTSGIH